VNLVEVEIAEAVRRGDVVEKLPANCRRGRRVGMPPIGEDDVAAMPDGQRFIINQPVSETGSSPLTVVLGWRALMNR
jgi:hypothetical protein